MKRAYIVGGILVLAFAALGVSQFKSLLTPYVGFQEAMASETQVQVKGKIVRESVRFDREANRLIFDITDEEGRRMTVEYGRAAPGNFAQASHVVAVGQAKNGVFEARDLLIKCPSKYQGETYTGTGE
jgi:cytochrome c-type biogenesis protein CcmE